VSEPDEPTAALPAPVRARVLMVAGDALGVMSAELVPAALRRFRSFTPARRRQLAGPAIAVALETDESFRQAVGDRLTEAFPELCAAIAARAIPPAADPIDVATIAYLQRTEGWQTYVASVPEVPSRIEVAPVRQERGADREREKERARELAAERQEVARLRAQVREISAKLRAADGEATRRASAAEAEQARLAARISALEATERRLVRERDAVAAELERERAHSRGERRAVDVRQALMLATLRETVAALGDELGLPATADRPADLLLGPLGGSSPLVARLDLDDPAALDRLFAVPLAHLVIDGYNVTKTGYPEMPLADQRDRLVATVAALVGHRGVETTIVFDGAGEGDQPRMARQRGLRVAFTPAGQIADDLIRDLVAAEPPGRVVVVVSSDNEVREGVRRPGVYPVHSAVLLRRLDRG
jgi:predicted RNA-binding protein with PIN domain